MNRVLFAIAATLAAFSGYASSESYQPLPNRPIKSHIDNCVVYLTPGLDTLPSIRHGKTPPHPIYGATRSGYAEVEFTIDENGRTKDIVTVRKNGEGFAGNTKYAVRFWRFEPATLLGAPIECRARYSVTFTGVMNRTQQRPIYNGAQ